MLLLDVAEPSEAAKIYRAIDEKLETICLISKKSMASTVDVCNRSYLEFVQEEFKAGRLFSKPQLVQLKQPPEYGS